jgi:tetratricopeptide (TPR) repeat protein
MMGIFDRPADQGAIDVLRTEVPIEGVTTEVGKLSDKQWEYVLRRLRDLNLLADKTENPESGTLDCHPVVREYFGDRLKQDNPDAWREAHSCLFDYYRNLPGKKYPETLKDMEPLFFAITHGCHAGRHQEALDEVYWDRIRRGNTSYSVKKLGAVGADLAALSDFFDVAWKTPTGGLGAFRKALVLSWVGSRLRPLGRLKEASQAVTASLDEFVKQENWKEAAVNAGNLSEIYLALGEMKKAAGAARLGAEFSERSGDIFQQIVRNADLANVLHHCGYIKEAEELFLDAEDMQKKRQPDHPYLYSLQGFQYCDFLLMQGKYSDVIDRAEQTLEWVAQAGWLLDIAMDELTLGCAYLLQTQEEGGTDFTQAANYLDLAMAGLQRAESQHHLPRGLLARAALFRLKKEFSNAWKDLNEVSRIAQRGKMKLFMADYYLEASRLFVAEGNRTGAREHVGIAKNMINRMGYHRRDKEVKELMESV